jgi:hypothetical protein
MRPTNGSHILQHTLGVILIAIACVRPASAQVRVEPAPGPAYALFRPAPTPPPARPPSFISRAPDYRWEGLAIGAIAGGVYFGSVARTLCDGGNCVDGIAHGAALGGTLGGLFGCFVGMFIPKHHSASTTRIPTPTRRTA